VICSFTTKIRAYVSVRRLCCGLTSLFCQLSVQLNCFIWSKMFQL